MKAELVNKAMVKMRRMYIYSMLINYYSDNYKPNFMQMTVLGLRNTIKAANLAKYIKENKK